MSEKIGGIINSVKEKLGIHSPSKVFAGIGENMALGLAEGWDDEYSDIKRTIERGMNFGAAAAAVSMNSTGYSSPRAGQYEPGTGFGVAGGVTVNIYNPERRDSITEAREWTKTMQRAATQYG